jgi:iron complex outermembrane receptor protein
MHSAEEQGSEHLKAAEVGLRSQWAPGLSTDFVVFNHRYDNLLRTNGGQTIVPGFPLTVVNVDIVNGGEMNLNGAELSADWRIDPAWRLQLAQTWNDVTHVGAVEIAPSASVPNSISSLRLSWTPASSVNVDAWLRRTSGRTGIPNKPYDDRRNAFNEFDLRVAWRPQKALELSLTGQNLNNGTCDALAGVLTASSNTGLIPTCQPRSLVGQVRIDF